MKLELRRTNQAGILAIALAAGLVACQSDPSPGTSAGASSAGTTSASQFLGGRWIDSAGNFLIADSNNNVVREVLARSGTMNAVAGISSPLLHLPLVKPYHVATDRLNRLYIVDPGGCEVRREDGQTVTRVAGTGACGYGGDGGLATNAQLSAPTDAVVDGSGNLYIVDSSNHVIREVSSATGLIRTVAGIPQSGGYSGDGGAATSAQLNSPVAIALDSANNIYISDLGNGVIREVTFATGMIATVAGTPGVSGYSGDGGLAVSAQLNNSRDIVLDSSNNLYIADSSNEVIRRVDSVTGIITAMAGTPGSASESGDGGLATAATLYYPVGLAMDSSDNLYISDTSGNVIRRVAGATGIITTVAGTPGSGGGYSGDGGPATSAILNNPVGIALDSSNNLYIADTENQVIREVSAVTETISTVAGNASSGYSGDGGTATSAVLNGPMSAAVDSSGNVYIADSNNNVIRKVDTSGKISTVVGNYNLGAGYGGDDEAGTSAQLYNPDGIALDSSNNLYFADFNNDVIRRFDSATGIITTIVGTKTRGYSGDGELAVNAELLGPTDVALDVLGDLYIADAENNVIRRVDALTGIITTVAGHGLTGYSGDDGLATNAALDHPMSVALDGSNNLFIADMSNGVVRKVDALSGIITTVAGIGGFSGYSGDGGPATEAKLNNPQAVALDAQGNLYIGDTGNNVIRKVDANGNITTVAGNGTQGFSGDGGFALGAELSQPFFMSQEF